MDEEPPPTRGSREKCSHMCRIGRSSEWRNLMPIKRLFHTRRALSSAQIQTLVFYRLWKWLTARVACWWRVSTIIEIIHSYLSPVNLLLSNYNRGVTESAWKVVENFFLRELTGNRRREDCGWYRIKEAERWSLCFLINVHPISRHRRSKRTHLKYMWLLGDVVSCHQEWWKVVNWQVDGLT